MWEYYRVNENNDEKDCLIIELMKKKEIRKKT